MTNNPKKVVGLEGYGLEVVERVPLEINPNDINKDYLETKKTKMGHLFSSGTAHDKLIFGKLFGR
jgi:3,4-dihydroxy 2-butanone 4-phosphate synthase/GTP cyclohydrolase II